MNLLLAALLHVAPPQRTVAPVCYHFDQKYFQYFSTLGIGFDSTDVLALQQSRDTTEGPPIGAPDDAFPIDAPLLDGSLTDADVALDRAWWRRDAGDTLEITWQVGPRLSRLRVRVRGDSATGGVSSWYIHERPMGRPLPVRASRVACPAARNRPTYGMSMGGSSDGSTDIHVYSEGGSAFVGAVIFRTPPRGTHPHEIAAAQEQRFDSLQRAVRSRGRWLVGSPDTFGELDFNRRELFLQGQTYTFPVKRQLLVIMVDLIDSVGGRPTVMTRLIKHAHTADPPAADSANVAANPFFAVNRILRADSVVRRFIDRP